MDSIAVLILCILSFLVGFILNEIMRSNDSNKNKIEFSKRGNNA